MITDERGGSGETPIRSLEAKIATLEGQNTSLQAELNLLKIRIDTLEKQNPKLQGATPVHIQPQEETTPIQSKLHQIKTDVQKLTHSRSPVAWIVAGVVQTGLESEYSEAVAESQELSLNDLFNEINAKPRLEVHDAGQKVSILMCRDRSYYLIYKPRGQDSIALKQLLTGIRNPDRAQYTMDESIFALRIDPKANNPGAVPVVIFRDKNHSLTGGTIHGEIYDPPEYSIKPLVKKVKQILSEGTIKLGDRIIPSVPVAAATVY